MHNIVRKDTFFFDKKDFVCILWFSLMGGREGVEGKKKGRGCVWGCI